MAALKELSPAHWFSQRKTLGVMSDLLRSVSPFQDTLVDIATWASERDVILTRTHFTKREGMPIARWPDGTWQDFLRAARKTGTKLVWVEVRRYAAMEEKENGELSDGALSVVEDAPDAAREMDDETSRSLAALELSWSCDGVLNVFLAKMSWEEPTRSSTTAAADIEHDLEKIIERAKLLIDLPRYASKESREERRRLARRMFGSKVAVDPIVKQAEALTEASQKTESATEP
jgi:hypothetical protein